MDSKCQYIKMTSQHGEDKYLRDQWLVEQSHAQLHGVFVEIGGLDGLRYSNTYWCADTSLVSMKVSS